MSAKLIKTGQHLHRVPIKETCQHQLSLAAVFPIKVDHRLCPEDQQGDNVELQVIGLAGRHKAIFKGSGFTDDSLFTQVPEGP